jgi:hypothetical protein
MTRERTRRRLDGGYQYFSDTKPTPQDVLIRRILRVHKPAARRLDATVPAKEQEEIAGTDFVSVKVTARGVASSKSRSPTAKPRNRCPLDIGIEMTTRFYVWSKISKQARKPHASRPEFAVRDRSIAFGDRKRYELPIL